MTSRPLVLDTNILLDLFVFQDAATAPLRGMLDAGTPWLATTAMRDELARVLGYPQIVPRLAFYALHAATVLAQFDRGARMVEVPAKAPVTCADADDQKFIDLAVAHQALLLSKDKAVLSMARRLATRSVLVQSALPAQALLP
ncbi:MAG TPA: PIN domain-containing protein [Ramlibacter sp.]|nr:PIN domain-containing protein [Ramlibacter sp.]